MSATPEHALCEATVRDLRAHVAHFQAERDLALEANLKYATENFNLRSQLAEAQRDTERLDWLNGRLNWFTTQGPGHDPKYADIRERIDAARSTPERGDPEGTNNG